ncbi:MAG: hypothetical protein U9N50_14465 [Pseudomonadota bacterium]|nr:hypothetical protein [Pseudomonadota bacterium]
MKNTNYFNSVRKPFASIMLIAIASFFTSTACAQTLIDNPWLESSRPLIDGNPILSDSNSWRASEDSFSKDEIDESKYPPLDEDETLGTSYPVLPSERAPAQSGLPGLAGSGFHYPQAQDFEPIPVYPDNTRRDASAYPDRQFSSYPRGYPQRGYQPGYPTGFGQGYNPMGEFPFGGNSGRGSPFGGYTGTGSPFGMGNGWMPFSGPGMW